MEENKKNISKHKMNLPNRITLIRVILLPFIIIIPLLAKIDSYNNFLAKNIIIPGVLEAEYNITWCNVIVLIIFVAAAITDAIDGHIARSRKLVTDFGKFLDPLADKLLVTVAMLVLLEEGRLWGWVVAIILAREFAVTGLRSIAASQGNVIAASMYGKVKTTFQMIMIILLLINNFPFSIIYIHTGIYIPMDKIMIVVATLLTIISGVDYFIKNKEVLKDM